MNESEKKHFDALVAGIESGKTIEHYEKHRDIWVEADDARISDVVSWPESYRTAPERVERWVNVHYNRGSPDTGYMRTSLEDHRNPSDSQTLHLTWEDGKLIDAEVVK